MTLLVTGGAGYIGSVVVERALARGHRIVVIDNLQEGHAAAVPPECRLVQADYGDRTVLDAIFAAEAVEAVVHLAAETTVATSVSDPAIYFQNNTVNGVALLEAMRRHGVMRLVFSSTAATYGEPVSVPMTEDHPQQPINAYGESKLMFERMIRRVSPRLRAQGGVVPLLQRRRCHRRARRGPSPREPPHSSGARRCRRRPAVGQRLRVRLPDQGRHLRA